MEKNLWTDETPTVRNARHELSYSFHARFLSKQYKAPMELIAKNNGADFVNFGLGLRQRHLV